MIEDFNDMVDGEEKEGGNYCFMASMGDFWDFLAEIELLDLDFEGYPFTWRNKCDDRLTQQWLDRGLATSGWMDGYIC